MTDKSKLKPIERIGRLRNRATQALQSGVMCPEIAAEIEWLCNDAIETAAYIRKLHERIGNLEQALLCARGRTCRMDD
jgi:hypothetical protein